MNNLRNSPYTLLIVLAAIILIVVGIYSLLALPSDDLELTDIQTLPVATTTVPLPTAPLGDPGTISPAEPVACTMDAKSCPDGSAVGRIPPRCEFAPCPGN